MSQFDLPRINFHGTAFLDTATANNGNYGPPLTLFDQNESEAFIPPRCYLPGDYTYQPPQGVQILKDKNGNFYVPISVITADNYQQWASTPLGSFQDDSLYWSLYTSLKLTGSNPGYWSYFGDLSISLINTKVTGITLDQTGGGVVNYSPGNQQGCPSFFANMFGAEFSFNNDFFAKGSRTSAYLCDTDSIGQMCTQIFCGQAGLYKTDAQGNQVTFFSGTPVKSTARWMNLNKVLNYSDRSLLPMGGSASFYAKIELNNGSDLLKIYQQYSGKTPTSLFLKLMVHEVYEVREPDYSKLPTQAVFDLYGNQSEVPKNPARASVSGSITPYFDEDMKTASISRLMKNDKTVAIDTSSIPHPVTNGGTKLSVPNAVNLAPIQFIHNTPFNLLSFDISNAINEYGINPASRIGYSGNGDIPAFQSFESYDFGTFSIWFQSDSGGTPLNIGNFDFNNNYNMQQLLATGGIIDFNVNHGADYSQGYFYATLNETTVFTEDSYFIISDQMGNYAQQNQADNNYMSDGLPKIPCTLRVFYRGSTVAQNNSIPVTQQAINMRTGAIVNTPNFMVYDGLAMNFPVDADGCLTYGFIDSKSQIWDGSMPQLFKYAMNTSMIVLRTLSSEPQLSDYLNGTLPITWDVVFNNVFSLFKIIYPVMDAIIPFTQKNWSDPFILNKMKTLTADTSWNQPLYMPVTRDLSDPQKQLLQMWADQILNPDSNI